MGKYGPADVTVTYDDAPGGTPRAITGFVMELGEATIELDHVRSDAFGDAWREWNATGKQFSPDIPVSGQWDTTATTGPHVVLRPSSSDASPNASTRTLAIVFGDGKTFTVETRLIRYGVKANNNDLTGFNAVIRPTGAAVWS